MQVLPQTFIFTFEQLQQDGEHSGWLHVVLPSHNFQTGHKSVADFRVQNAVILLQQIKHLLRQKACNLVLVHVRDMCEKLEVVNGVLVLLRWVFFEIGKFL